MFVAEALISNEWTALDDLVSNLEENVPYTIINSSNDCIYCVESATNPAEGLVGIPCPFGVYINYIKGEHKLYFRNDAKPDTSGAVKPSRITIHKKG